MRPRTVEQLLLAATRAGWRLEITYDDKYSSALRVDAHWPAGRDIVMTRRHNVIYVSGRCAEATLGEPLRDELEAWCRKEGL